jgi:phosphatidylglycerophosphate synthase
MPSTALLRDARGGSPRSAHLSIRTWTFYFLGAEHANRFVIFLLLATITGSFLTSYARARAEGLGLECRIGWLERPERIVLLILGLLLGHVVLIAVIAFLAVLTIFTFLQRVIHVRRLTSYNDREKT